MDITLANFQIKAISDLMGAMLKPNKELFAFLTILFLPGNKLPRKQLMFDGKTLPMLQEPKNEPIFGSKPVQKQITATP